VSEYWWDRSGHDPQLERVEALLRPLAFGGQPLSRSAVRRQGRRRHLGIAASVAAAAGLAVLGGWAAVRWAAARGTAWQVYAIAGTPTLGGGPLAAAATWTPSQVLETGPETRAKILAGRIGEIDVEPGSRLRLLRTERRQQRLALDQGMVRAFILAPPRQFFIETREAVAADLGCAYSLSVAPSGDGWLRVAFGWVAFESAASEVYVPAGAACAVLARRGPGTPHYEDAAPGFRSALGRLDAGEPHPDALPVLLESARRKDALTLVQLIPRVAPAERGRVYDRLSALLPVAGVDRAAILRGEYQGLDHFWHALGLGEMKWWRVAGDPRAVAPPNRR